MNLLFFDREILFFSIFSRIKIWSDVYFRLYRHSNDARLEADLCTRGLIRLIENLNNKCNCVTCDSLSQFSVDTRHVYFKCIVAHTFVCFQMSLLNTVYEHLSVYGQFKVVQNWRFSVYVRSFLIKIFDFERTWTNMNNSVQTEAPTGKETNYFGCKNRLLIIS